MPKNHISSNLNLTFRHPFYGTCGKIAKLDNISWKKFRICIRYRIKIRMFKRCYSKYKLITLLLRLFQIQFIILIFDPCFSSLDIQMFLFLQNRNTLRGTTVITQSLILQTFYVQNLPPKRSKLATCKKGVISSSLYENSSLSR